VSPDPAPDNVRLTGNHLGSIRESRAAIRRPAHLPDARFALNKLDPELRCERLVDHASDEQAKRADERPTLLRPEVAPSLAGTGAALGGSAPIRTLPAGRSLDGR
jgi:hypothetical protein